MQNIFHEYIHPQSKYLMKLHKKKKKNVPLNYILDKLINYKLIFLKWKFYSSCKKLHKDRLLISP